MRGEVDVGRARVRAARQNAMDLDDAEIAANAALLAGRILTGEGRVHEARELLDEAHTQAQTFGLRTMVASLDELRAGLVES